MRVSIELERRATTPRCPYCHDDDWTPPRSACGRCNVPHHLACFVGHGGCSVLGCRSLPAPRPAIQLVERRPATRRVLTWRRVALLSMLGCLALASTLALGSLTRAAPPPEQPRGPALAALKDPELPPGWEEKRSNERFAVETLAKICRAERAFEASRSSEDPRRCLSQEELVNLGVLDPAILLHGYVFVIHRGGNGTFESATAYPNSGARPAMTPSRARARTCARGIRARFSFPPT